MVSVIVPVYNVEKYLIQCLNSLKAQTLKDVEFIIIDDGSTDTCGKICDGYARDSRFRIFHTNNCGLSAARNRGIDEARGEWLQFVDSDDWVDPEFCEIPLRAAVENNADLVIFQYTICFSNKQIKKNRKAKGERAEIVTHERAIDFGKSYTWNKIYKKSLFDDIRFPEGHVYEDWSTTHRLIYNARRVFILPDSLIYYRIRDDSISHTRCRSFENDRMVFQMQRYDDLIEKGYPKEKALVCLQAAALRYCVRMPVSNDELSQKVDEILSKKSVFLPGWKKKIQIKLWKKNKQFFHLLYRIFGKKI